MMPDYLRPTRRTAVLFVATLATLVLAIVFDFTAFASTVFPALWITFGWNDRCVRPPSNVAH